MKLGEASGQQTESPKLTLHGFLQTLHSTIVPEERSSFGGGGFSGGGTSRSAGGHADEEVPF